MAVRVDPREDYRETILAGQESVLVVPARPAAPARRSRQGQDTTLAYTILTPTFAVILGMVAYPFFIGIWLSLQSKMVGAPGRFVGLQNYVELFRNDTHSTGCNQSMWCQCFLLIVVRSWLPSVPCSLLPVP